LLHFKKMDKRSPTIKPGTGREWVGGREKGNWGGLALATPEGGEGRGVEGTSVKVKFVWGRKWFPTWEKWDKEEGVWAW